MGALQQSGKYDRRAFQEVQSRSGAVRVQTWTNPLAASATAVHAAVTLGSAAQNVSTSLTNPDFPRNVTVKGNAGGIAGNCVITGTDMRGQVITETIALNGSTEVAGNKAFATVTNVNMPAKTNGSGDTVSVGRGVKMGLDRLLPGANTVLATNADGALDTASTVAASASAISDNTVIFNTAPNGTHDYLVVFVTQEITTSIKTTA